MDEDREDLHRSLGELLARCLERARCVGGNALASRIEVKWNRRMRSAAGRAFWPAARVELNPRLIEIGLDEVERTLLHELAHLVAYSRAGRRRIAPHGAEWRQACAELGIAGEGVTHRLNLPTRKMRKRWAYRCGHCGKELLRVQRIKRGAACAECCGQFNGGRYARRFRLLERRLPEGDG